MEADGRVGLADNEAGRLLGIYVAAQAGAPVQSVERIQAVAGRGLEGDRYEAVQGTFSERPGQRDVTLIAAEALETYERESGKKLSGAESRRNLLTQGVRLNDLVGCEFQVGAVRMRGLRLSEPCTHLQRLTHPETLRGLVHRAGLIAEVLNDGELHLGDLVKVLGGRMKDEVRARPPRLSIPIKVMAAFFAFGTLACSVTVAALLFPHSVLDGVWRLNPEARTGFQQMGAPLAIALMATVGTGCALAAFGLARGSDWGRRLALVILVVNLIGDTVNALARHDARTLIGLPIGGAMIWLLGAKQMKQRSSDG